METLANMNVRLQNVEKGIQNRDVENNEEEDEVFDGMNSSIGGKGSRGYGRGSRRKVRENPSYDRNRGYNDGVDRNLGSIKLKIP